MVEVSYHGKVNVLQDHGLASAGPFDRAEWFALLAESADAAPVVVLAREGNASAALVLKERGGRLEPLINWYSFAWRPLFNRHAERQKLLTKLAGSPKGRTARITLWPLPDEDGSARLLETAFRAAGWVCFRSQCDVAHVLLVAGRDYAAYLAARPGQLRTTLRRKAKKLDIEITTEFQDTDWDIYEKIYNASWKPVEGDPALLKAFARAEGAAGRLRLGIARHEGKPVAVQFWTVEGGTAFIHKLAHLPEAQPLSAGSVLTAALMERVIDGDKVHTVDFGTGDDSYKRDWMEAIYPRYLLDCHDRASPRAWPYIFRGLARRLASRGRSG